MGDYSAMKSYLEKNNIHYFTFSPNSGKPIKAVIRHLPPGTPAEDISNGLENSAFNVINARQMPATRTAPNGQIHVETLHLFLVALARNIKSQEIFKMNGLNHIIIKVELYRVRTGLTQCYYCQNFGHVWANCEQPLDVCGAVVATCMGSAMKRQIQNLRRAAAIAPSEKGRNVRI
jgi:hypothetical protein